VVTRPTGRNEWRALTALTSERCKNHVGRVGDDRQQRTRGSTRRTLALLPIPDRFDRDAKFGGEFRLGQFRPHAKFANRRHSTGLAIVSNVMRGQIGKRRLLPVDNLDDAPIRFQT
jgi:hypothetical protein